MGVDKRAYSKYTVNGSEYTIGFYPILVLNAFHTADRQARLLWTSPCVRRKSWSSRIN